MVKSKAEDYRRPEQSVICGTFFTDLGTIAVLSWRSRSPLSL